MTMPVMEPDLDAAVLRAWAQAIDEGPFASACFGERIAFDNPETLTLLGALAAWTDRVVGPPPVQNGGPDLLVGTMGPKTVRSAAAWADGLAGKPPPRLTTSFWFALGPQAPAREQVHCSVT